MAVKAVIVEVLRCFVRSSSCSCCPYNYFIMTIDCTYTISEAIFVKRFFSFIISLFIELLKLFVVVFRMSELESTFSFEAFIMINKVLLNLGVH